MNLTRVKKQGNIFSWIIISSFIFLILSCGGGSGGGTPAPPPPPPPPNPSTWKVIALGDSITVGYSADDPHSEGYVPKLSRLLGKNVINLGISGAHTIDVANNLVRNLEKYHPTHVLVLIGANDVEENPYDVNHYIEIMKYIVNTIRAYKAVPIVATLTPFCHEKWEPFYEKNINDRNAAIRSVLGQEMKVTIADMAKTFTCDMMDRHGGNHPNDWGYDVMAHVWYNILITNPKY